MSNNVYSVGLRNVGSYQVSGAPFVSGGVSSAVANGSRVAFPYVTSWVKVYNHGNQGLGVNIAFSQRQAQEEGAAGNTNYLYINGGLDSGVLELKLSEIWLSGSSPNITVVAGLTNIPVRQIDNTNVSPSGSLSANNLAFGNSHRNWSGSVGVG
jgi:hypothetical protein